MRTKRGSSKRGGFDENCVFIGFRITTTYQTKTVTILDDQLISNFIQQYQEVLIQTLIPYTDAIWPQLALISEID